MIVLVMMMAAAAMAQAGDQAAPAAKKCQIGELVALPVTMRGMQPMVRAKVNGTEVEFMADSGAFYSIITPGTAKDLGLRVERGGRNVRVNGIGGTADAYLATVKELSLGTLPLHDIPFLVGGSEVGHAAGVLGQNVLGFKDAEYDLGGGMIRMVEAVNCAKDARLAYWAGDKPYSVIPIEDTGRANQHIIGTILINGVKIKATFDTGAGTTVLNLRAAARAGVKPDTPGTEVVGVGRGFGSGVVKTYIASFKTLQIDQEKISNIKLRFSDMGNTDFDMLLGADFFLSHRVYVSNAQHKLYITYNGGPVFALGPRAAADIAQREGAVSADGPEPTDADGYSRRGASRLSRSNYEAAAADFDKAVELAPNEPRYLAQRASARLALRQPLRAKADLDQALKLKPNDVDALLVRARMYMGDRDREAARADVEAAARAATPAADQRFIIAALFSALDVPDRSIAEYSLWLTNHPDDSRVPNARNGRCFARALANVDLGKGLDDCNAAIRARPGTAAFLDSRGLVRLRMGDFAKSITDYDAALAINPRLAAALYARGLAKSRSGDTAGGKADIAAALAIAPRLTEEMRRRGLIPPDGEPR